MSKSREGNHDDFGSWYSSTGNVIGEAGVPYARGELDADKQKSVSFFYD